MDTILEALRSRDIADTDHVLSNEGIEGCLICGDYYSGTPCPMMTIGRVEAEMLVNVAESARKYGIWLEQTDYWMTTAAEMFGDVMKALRPLLKDAGDKG